MSASCEWDRSGEAARIIAARSGGATPAVGVILGSGMSRMAHQLEHATVIPYGELPYWPQAALEGHSGELVLGKIGGATVAALAGRAHVYQFGHEANAAARTAFPVRVLARLGVKRLVVTNAAGGINPGLRPGMIVAIADHINFLGNPLVGPNDARFGPRFPDMSEAYGRHWRLLARQVSTSQGWELAEGVYVAVTGPSYETPAEIRAFGGMRADLVGMSTVNEVIVARHCGLEVLGLSVVTNAAAGISAAALRHEDVLETTAEVEAKLWRFLVELLPRMAA